MTINFGSTEFRVGRSYTAPGWWRISNWGWWQSFGRAPCCNVLQCAGRVGPWSWHLYGDCECDYEGGYN